VVFSIDAVGAFKALPYVAVIGGNMGEPNPLTGVNIADLTGGVSNAKILLKGNNLLWLAVCHLICSRDPEGLAWKCFVVVEMLSDALGTMIARLDCPQLVKYDASLLRKFPGAGIGI
jgi:hypothetical protein